VAEKVTAALLLAVTGARVIVRWFRSLLRRTALLAPYPIEDPVLYLQSKSSNFAFKK
jgi:hypothetical protein